MPWVGDGALIVSVTALAVWLWMQGQATVGLVAAATALVLRLNNMTYWIMWAMTTLVQSLGVVAEGMQSIAQPIGRLATKRSGRVSSFTS